MKVIKSDGRYKFFNQGFNVILEFSLRDREESRQYATIFGLIEEMFGLHRQFDQKTSLYKFNENYRVATTSTKRSGKRRIYLKNETEVSLILLKVNF
mgnify:FL=1